MALGLCWFHIHVLVHSVSHVIASYCGPSLVDNGMFVPSSNDLCCTSSFKSWVVPSFFGSEMFVPSSSGLRCTSSFRSLVVPSFAQKSYARRLLKPQTTAHPTPDHLYGHVAIAHYKASAIHIKVTRTLVSISETIKYILPPSTTLRSC